MVGMKPSGIDWVGDIPVGWEVSKIKYVSSFIGSGTTPESSNDEYYGGELNWIQSGDLYQNDYINDTERKITHRAVKKITTLQLYKQPFLVMAMYGASIGNIAISNIDAYVNQACCCIIPSSRNNLSYLYYFLIASKNDILLQAVGGGQPNISQIIIKNRYCLVPPLPEQQAIAAFLDTRCRRIDGIIAEMEQQIDILKQYKTSLITETVTKGLNKAAPMKDSGIDWIGKMPVHWELKRLKYIGTAKNGLTYAPENISDDGVLVLRSSNIQEGELAFEDNVYVKMKIPSELIVKENDILICSRNGSRELIGKCVLIDKKISGHTYGAFMCVFRSCYNQFIYYVFQSNLFNYYLGNYLTSTINQLTNANLYSMEIPISFDMEELSRIAAFLDEKCGKIADIITTKRQSIETMKAYKKSLIYEYVTGKKRVKGYQ
jgi:type I restriction enzyme S subunit